MADLLTIEGLVASTADVGSFAWRRLVPHGAMASPGAIGRPLAFTYGASTLTGPSPADVAAWAGSIATGASARAATASRPIRTRERALCFRARASFIEVTPLSHGNPAIAPRPRPRIGATRASTRSPYDCPNGAGTPHQSPVLLHCPTWSLSPDSSPRTRLANRAKGRWIHDHSVVSGHSIPSRPPRSPGS